MENCIEIKELNKFYGKKKQAYFHTTSGKEIVSTDIVDFLLV